MQKLKIQNGITLIALVVTIVGLLILAGITIGLVFGSSGIIKKAQEANENTKIAQVREQLELAKGPEYIEGNGKYDPDSYFQRIEDEGIIENKDKDKEEIEDGKYKVITVPGYIFIITLIPSKDNVEDIQIDYVGKIEGPRIREINITNKTTNSISIEVDTVNAKGATYRYYYKKEGEEEWTKAGEGKENTYTFNGLEENKVYNIKVEVEKDGKVTEEETSSMTGEMPKGAVQFSPVEWENGKASTVITTSEEGYTLQYQIGGIAEESWKNTTSGSTIGDLEDGTTVYGRLYDGTNGSKTANIDVEDKINPTVVVTEGTITTKSIVVNVEAVDNESGMKETPTYTYYIKKTGEADSAYQAKATEIESASYTFTGLAQKTAYDIKVEVNGDKASNVGEGKLLNKETEEIGGATGGLIEGNIIASSPTWSNGQASITLSTSTGLTIQWQKNGIEGSWTTGTSVTGLNHNDTVYARLTDGVNYGDYASVIIQDKIAPTATLNKGTVTTNSIAVNLTGVSDGQTGLATSGTYKYYLGSTLKSTSTTSNYTFTKLADGTAYTIKVEIYDKAGNKATKTLSVTTETVGGATGGLVTGNIVASNPTWSNGQASITLSTSTGLTIQWQKNSISGSWTTGTSVTGLNHNDTVYARLTDGVNYGDYASVIIQDKIAPNVPTITLSGTAGNNGYYKSNVTVKITAGSDGQSGANKVRYKVTGAQTVLQTDTAAGTVSASITISTNGTSTITAYTIDKAGNISSEKTQVVYKDSTAPTATLTVGAKTENSIAVSVSASDGQSGLATSGTYKYYINNALKSTNTSNNYTFTGLTAGTSYTLKVIVADKAGNTIEKSATASTNVSYPLASSILKEGDYVIYPEGNKFCMVLYGHSKVVEDAPLSAYGVQLITVSTVTDNFALGGNDSSTAINSYNNAISTLNNAANQYNNSLYSTARCVGSDPANPNSESNYGSYYGYLMKKEDSNHLTDVRQMKSLGILDIGKKYWLASRYVYSNSGDCEFALYAADNTTYIQTSFLFYYR